MIAALCGILFVLGDALATPAANSYVERIIFTDLPNEMRSSHLEPAPLQNFYTEFFDKIVIIGKVKGRVDYTNGNLTGLSQMRRNSECQGPYYSFGSRKINCTIAFDHLRTTFKGSMKYGKMPNVNITGRGNITITVLFVEMTSDPGQQYAHLTTMQFRQVGTVQPQFTGLGPLNRFMKPLEDGYKSYVSAQVANSLQSSFSYAFNRALLRVPMPN